MKRRDVATLVLAAAARLRAGRTLRRASCSPGSVNSSAPSRPSR